MTSERDPSDTIPLMLRIREDLRQELEQSARAKRVSLNQECIDRLSYVRDRKGLLAEVMRLSFGERMAGLLLALGLAMSRVAYGHRRLRDRGQSPPEWIDDPTIFNEMVQAANMLLHAARPTGGEARPTRVGRHYAREVIATMGGKARPMPALMPTLPAKEVEAIQELLGPVAQRMTALQVRDALVSRIAMGEWKPNATIPNEGDLARELDVSPETMRRALDLMEDERLLTRRATTQESDKPKAKGDD